jgi:hypothetical protein
MRIHQAEVDRRKALIPALVQFVEDREPLIKFHGEGRIAVASLFQAVSRVFPPCSGIDLIKEFEGKRQLLTVVMERIKGEWLIVHTHPSDV